MKKRKQYGGFSWPQSKHAVLVFLVMPLFLFLTSCSTSAFFYAPVKELRGGPDTALYSVEEINFKAGDGKVLNGWFIKPKGIPVIGTVLQLHGNGGNISYQFQFAAPLIKSGFQVMVFDYEGYGRSEGKPSQEKVLDDARCALHYCKARQDVQGTKLILFGQSLGGHLSCVVAAMEQSNIDALVVEAPFSGHKQIAAYIGKHAYHLPKFLAYLLVPSKYSALDYIDQVKVPKLFIHSPDDKVCPYFMGKQLYDKAVGEKSFWEVSGPHIQASHLFPDEFDHRFLELVK